MTDHARANKRKSVEKIKKKHSFITYFSINTILDPVMVIRTNNFALHMNKTTIDTNYLSIIICTYCTDHKNFQCLHESTSQTSWIELKFDCNTQVNG